MPELRKREDVEARLLAEMQTARRRYRNKECTAEVYIKALRRLNDFLIEGKSPEDETPLGDPKI
jgi:hypothetical protein